MTIDEIKEVVDGFTYRQQMQASFDYQLANLIGISVGRCVSNKVKLPKFEEAYSFLFTNEEIQKLEEQKKRAEQIKQENEFLAFVNKHNAKIRNTNEGR